MQSRIPTHSSFLLVLAVGEGDVGELKVSLAVLQAPCHAPRGVTLLPQVALAEDQMVDVTAVLHADLSCDCEEGTEGSETLSSSQSATQTQQNEHRSARYKLNGCGEILASFPGSSDKSCAEAWEQG